VSTDTADLAADALDRLAADLEAQAKIPAAPDMTPGPLVEWGTCQVCQRSEGFADELPLYRSGDKLACGSCADDRDLVAEDPHAVARAAAASDVAVSRAMVAGALRRAGEERQARMIEDGLAGAEDVARWAKWWRATAAT